jgi:hypothetical protein
VPSVHCCLSSIYRRGIRIFLTGVYRGLYRLAGTVRLMERWYRYKVMDGSVAVKCLLLW